MTTTETAIPERHSFQFRRVDGERPTLIINGTDVVDHISGVQIVSDAVSGTRVALEVPAHRLNDVVFDGIARVTIDVYENDPGPAAVVFLSALDPETVEKDALNRLDLDNTPGGTTAAILRTLIDYAETGGAR